MKRELFRIIATAPSAFAFPKSDGLVFENELSGDEDPVLRIAISSVWQDFPPFALEELPVALQLSVDLWADDLDEVVPLAEEVIIGFTDTLAVCVNAAIGIPQTRCIFTISPGATRSIREYFSPIEYPLVRAIRCQHSTTLFQAVRALYRSRDSEEVGLAMSHYKAALSFYGTAQLIFAFESLCIATEILGEPFVHRELRKRDMPIGRTSIKRLAEEMGHYPPADPKGNWRDRLYDDIRVKEIFRSDSSLYKRVAKGTNGFEHGTMPPARIRSIAHETIGPLFEVLRRAFSGLAELDTEVWGAFLRWPPIGPEPVRDYIDATYALEQSEVRLSSDIKVPSLGMAQQILSAEIVDEYLKVERTFEMKPQLGMNAELINVKYSLATPYELLDSETLSSDPGLDPN